MNRTAVGLSRGGTHVLFDGEDVDGRDVGERKRRRPSDGYARP